jgi:hypothetical protein
MSTLVAQTLSNGTVSTSTANCIQGSAKAWVNFNGSGTPAIRTSFNVSSVTSPSTGLYTINFTNAMVDANYVVTTESAPDNNATTAGAWITGVYSASGSGPILKTSTQVQIRTAALNGAGPVIFNGGVVIHR